MSASAIALPPSPLSSPPSAVPPPAPEVPVAAPRLPFDPLGSSDTKSPPPAPPPGSPSGGGVSASDPPHPARHATIAAMHASSAALLPLSDRFHASMIVLRLRA